jgi:hypothetical protein
MEAHNTAGRTYKAPGKKGDSANPRKIRTHIMPVKFLVAAVHKEIPPHMKIAVGMYRDGFSRVRRILLGTCPRR